MLRIGSAGATNGFCWPTPACRETCTVLTGDFGSLVSLRGVSTLSSEACLLNRKTMVTRTAKTRRGRSIVTCPFIFSIMMVVLNMLQNCCVRPRSLESPLRVFVFLSKRCGVARRRAEEEQYIIKLREAVMVRSAQCRVNEDLSWKVI